MILNGALGWLSLLDHLSELGPVGYEVALSLGDVLAGDGVAVTPHPQLDAIRRHSGVSGHPG